MKDYAYEPGQYVLYEECHTCCLHADVKIVRIERLHRKLRWMHVQDIQPHTTLEHGKKLAIQHSRKLKIPIIERRVNNHDPQINHEDEVETKEQAVMRTLREMP